MAALSTYLVWGAQVVVSPGVGKFWGILSSTETGVIDGIILEGADLHNLVKFISHPQQVVDHGEWEIEQI